MASSHATRRPPAVVVALNNVNGLGTVRALGRKGVPVVAIVPARRTPMKHTRYCSTVTCEDLFDKDQLLGILIRTGEQLPRKTAIFPSGDHFLSILSENREVLGQYYHFPFPDRSKVRLIAEKVLFYRFALEHGLPISPTFFPASIEDVKEIARNIAYPCLVKPSWATVAWRRRGLKVLPATNATELLSQYELAIEIQPELVIQEVTPGPDSALHFSITYLDRTGTPLAMFTGRKLRQNRPRYGISSMAQSLWIPEVAELTRKVLSAMDYVGYASVEFKKHPATGEYFMTEVTGRTWYPHGLSERCGINLPHLIYEDLVENNRPQCPPQRFEEGVKWIDEVGDFKSASQYWRERELSLIGWINSYRGKKVWALAARDDPKPIIALAYQLVARFSRALGRRILRRSRTPLSWLA